MNIFKKKRFVIYKENSSYKYIILLKCDLRGVSIFFKYNTHNRNTYSDYMIRDKMCDVEIYGFENCKKYIDDVCKKEII